MSGKATFLALLAVPMMALAADRHVLLDLDGDGYADPCPNPAHDDYLAVDNVVPCDGTGAFDLDNDGTVEAIYCHPQACLYEMAKSDSCEVHAGTYTAAGAMCDEDCWSAVNDACDRGDCWFATVIAHGFFQDGHTDGYGTDIAPGYLRGAQMLGSTDTWDSNQNRVRDDLESVTTYAPIFSGDRENPGTYDAISCSSNNCSGDTFFGVYLGCGDADNTSTFCDATPQAGSTFPKVDTDGNGTFDTQLGAGRKNVDHLRIQDIAFTRYTGGHTFGVSGQGLRQHGMHLGLWGAGDTEGLRYTRVAFYDSQYTLNGTGENWWSIFGDQENSECAAGGEAHIEDGYFEVNNRNFYNDDCDSEDPGASECGCAIRVHDNTIWMNGGANRQHLAYLKSIDTLGLGTRKKDHKFWNNEIIWENTNTGFWLWDGPQGFGNSRFNGQGEMWFYGNLVRIRGSGTFSRLWYGLSCARDTGSYRFYHFNNTYDLERADTSTREIAALCTTKLCSLDATHQCSSDTNCLGNCTGDGTTDCNDDGDCSVVGGTCADYDGVCSVNGGEIIVEKNNAFYKATGVHATGNVDTISRENAICSQGSQTSCTQNATGRTGWWTAGTKSVAVSAGLANYIPLAAGPLDNVSTNTPCDPDDDGAAGVDYDADGVNDTSWLDIAGNQISCANATDILDIGAIQNDSDVPPPTTTGTMRGTIIRGGTLR